MDNQDINNQDNDNNNNNNNNINYNEYIYNQDNNIPITNIMYQDIYTYLLNLNTNHYILPNNMIYTINTPYYNQNLYNNNNEDLYEDDLYDEIEEAPLTDDQYNYMIEYFGNFQ
jgi:hypothetical protein